MIVVKDAVKEVGNYIATVRLHKEVSVDIPFEVKEEGKEVVQKKEKKEEATEESN